MHIYMLSFFKAPKKVISKLTSLQRNFLWSNKSGVRGIPLVVWSEVCKPKRFRGLGVKDLSHFNEALLGKWKWRRLVDPGPLWVRIYFSEIILLAMEKEALVVVYGAEISGWSWNI
ncbi:hypothetical protein Lal_00025630 [Lupinus albus]|nr:hypothetical protein Lal_00025630 [Lupinus albus]